MADKKKNVPENRTNKVALIGFGIAVALIIIILIVRGVAGSGTDATSKGGDITITKSEVTEKAKFIPYKAGKTKMEVIAIKAPDGSIRTAFNTCQVCFNSGRGYYVQEGDELVCQNCGNRFKADQVEVITGGCNPVPITPEYKTDDGTTITIPGQFLEANKELFTKWKK